MNMHQLIEHLPQIAATVGELKLAVIRGELSLGPSFHELYKMVEHYTTWKEAVIFNDIDVIEYTEYDDDTELAISRWCAAYAASCADREASAGLDFYAKRAAQYMPPLGLSVFELDDYVQKHFPNELESFQLAREEIEKMFESATVYARDCLN